MMNGEADISSLAARAVQEFASVPHPGNRIMVEDCCEDHDAWNKWCSVHTNEEFFEALSKGGFDPFEFGGLYPEAYHYFCGAVVRYCLDQMNRRVSVIEPWVDWVHSLCPLRERQEEFSAQYVSCFTKRQRSVVAELLKSYAKRYFEEEELRDEDSERAAEFVWGEQVPSGNSQG